MKTRMPVVIYAAVVVCMLATTVWSFCVFAETSSVASHLNPFDTTDPHLAEIARKTKSALGLTLFSYIAGVVIFLCTAMIARANANQALNGSNAQRPTESPGP